MRDPIPLGSQVSRSDRRTVVDAIESIDASISAEPSMVNIKLFAYVKSSVYDYQPIIPKNRQRRISVGLFPAFLPLMSEAKATGESELGIGVLYFLVVPFYYIPMPPTIIIGGCTTIYATLIEPWSASPEYKDTTGSLVDIIWTSRYSTTGY